MSAKKDAATVAMYRTSFCPKPSVRVADKHSSAVVYIWTLAGRPGATGFRGQQTRNSFHSYFKSEAKRVEYVARFFVDVAADESHRLDVRAERKAPRHREDWNSNSRKEQTPRRTASTGMDRRGVQIPSNSTRSS